MKAKQPNPFMALGAGVIAVAAVPMVMLNAAAGIAMLCLPLWMVYKAS